MDLMIVFIHVNIGTNFIDQAVTWCAKNNIMLDKYVPIYFKNTFGGAMITGFDFYFTNEEDAVAFKLRWL